MTGYTRKLRFAELKLKYYSVPAEDVAGVYLFLYVVQASVIAVGDDGLAPRLEAVEVVHHLGAEERAAVLQSRLVDDDLSALGLHSLHHALYRGLAEVVRVGLHGQAVYADDALPLFRGAEVAMVEVVIVARLAQHAVGDEVLPRAVALHDGLDEVLGHVGVVGQQLLGVLRQAIAAVAEGGVVVVRADAGVEAHAVDDGLRVQSLHLGVGVQLVEVGNSQGEVGVGEELHGLGLLHAHEEDGDVLLDGPFLQ